MGLHPSLKIDSATAQQRSVLTRIERIKDLMKKGIWVDGHRVTALPKIKVIKVKAKKAKAKAEGEEGAAPAEGAAAPAAPAAPAAKAAKA